jgi:hypothetical protein
LGVDLETVTVDITSEDLIHEPKLAQFLNKSDILELELEENSLTTARGAAKVGRTMGMPLNFLQEPEEKKPIKILAVSAIAFVDSSLVEDSETISEIKDSKLFIADFKNKSKL